MEIKPGPLDRRWAARSLKCPQPFTCLRPFHSLEVHGLDGCFLQIVVGNEECLSNRKPVSVSAQGHSRRQMDSAIPRLPDAFEIEFRGRFHAERLERLESESHSFQLFLWHLADREPQIS